MQEAQSSLSETQSMQNKPQNAQIKPQCGQSWSKGKAQKYIKRHRLALWVWKIKSKKPSKKERTTKQALRLLKGNKIKQACKYSDIQPHAKPYSPQRLARRLHMNTR